jgi:hypothetical protein
LLLNKKYGTHLVVFVREYSALSSLARQSQWFCALDDYTFNLILAQTWQSEQHGDCAANFNVEAEAFGQAT